MCRLPILHRAYATTTDIPAFLLQNCRPQSVSLSGLTEILIPKAIQRFLQRPALSAHITPDLGIGLHANKVGLIRCFVRSEEQSFCLEKGRRHAARTVPPLRSL